MENRVVITGLGVVSPIGIGVGQFWKAALEGRSGITAIRSFDPFPMETYRSRIAGQVADFNPSQFLEAVHADRVDRYAQFGLTAVQVALADAGLRMEEDARLRGGAIGCPGMGALARGERDRTTP